MNAQAVDLLKHILCPADRRYDLAKILAHPWINLTTAQLTAPTLIPREARDGAGDSKSGSNTSSSASSGSSIGGASEGAPSSVASSAASSASASASPSAGGDRAPMDTDAGTG